MWRLLIPLLLFLEPLASISHKQSGKSPKMLSQIFVNECEDIRLLSKLVFVQKIKDFYPYVLGKFESTSRDMTEKFDDKNREKARSRKQMEFRKKSVVSIDKATNSLQKDQMTDCVEFSSTSEKFGLEGGKKGKIIICGVCRNIGSKLPIIMKAMVSCGEAYDDYRIIIYENNSTDTTKSIKLWMNHNPKVTVFSEVLTRKELLSYSPSKVIERTEIIAMARNRVLKEALKSQYDDFDFLLMADRDFGELWDIPAILETPSRRDIEWDGVFANGLLPDGRFYDPYAYRAANQLLGPESLGNWWWINHDWFIITKNEPWFPVYSAFNGLGIYKRESLKGSEYSGVVTKDLDIAVKKWIDQGEIEGHNHIQIYKSIIENLPTYSSKEVFSTSIRKGLAPIIGLTLGESPNQLVWINENPEALLPAVCEHVTLHASMINKGKGKFFINPRLITHYHE